MSKFTTRKVDTRLLEYKDYLCSKEKSVSVTDWVNGEGYDICWTGEDGQQMVSLTHGDVKAFVAAFHLAMLPSSED